MRPDICPTHSPVLDLEDALGGKVCALGSRSEIRDVLDVAAALDRYTVDQLIGFARRLDAGLTDEDFADAGRRLDELDDDWFAPFGLGPAEVAVVRERFAGWPRLAPPEGIPAFPAACRRAKGRSTTAALARLAPTRRESVIGALRAHRASRCRCRQWAPSRSRRAARSVPSSSAHRTKAVVHGGQAGAGRRLRVERRRRLLKGVVAQWLPRCLAQIGSRSRAGGGQAGTARPAPDRLTQRPACHDQDQQRRRRGETDKHRGGGRVVPGGGCSGGYDCGCDQGGDDGARVRAGSRPPRLRVERRRAMPIRMGIIRCNTG
jgi:hypothetical protein